MTAKSPITFQGELPSSVDLVIIGGGIIGIFSALYARRHGLSVVVLEKGRVSAEQSSRNWGWVRQQGRDSDELPIVMEATRLWEDVDKELDGAAGFKRVGCFFLGETEARMAEFESWMETSRQHQLETRRLTAAELDQHIDGASQNWVGGFYTPSDARAEPWKAVASVAKLAEAEGVRIIENCAVRALDIQAGRVVGVITEKGRIRSEQTVLAGGAWSSLLLQRHGALLPQLAIRGTVAQTVPLPEVANCTAIDEDLSFRRREDGGFTISSRNEADFYIGPHAFRSLRYYLPVASKTFRRNSYLPAAPRGFPDAWTTPRKWDTDKSSPFEQMRVLDPAPNVKHIERAQKAFAKRFPSVGLPKILNAWAGMIDTMPDLVPAIGQVPNLEGLIVATGMSGHGFGMGPGVANIVAELAIGRTPSHDLQRFRFSRFSDGSKISLGPRV